MLASWQKQFRVISPVYVLHQEDCRFRYLTTALHTKMKRESHHGNHFYNTTTQLWQLHQHPVGLLAEALSAWSGGQYTMAIAVSQNNWNIAAKMQYIVLHSCRVAALRLSFFKPNACIRQGLLYIPSLFCIARWTTVAQYTSPLAMEATSG